MNIYVKYYLMHLLVYTAVKTSQNKLQAILRIYTNQNEIV